MTTATPAAEARHNDAMLLAARIMLALLFVLAGVTKLGAMEGTVGYIAAMGVPAPTLAYFGTVALEIVAGLMLVVGFKMRWAAFALAVFSVMTAVIFHSDFSQEAEITSFLKNVAIAGGLLALAAAGTGRFGFDRT